MGLFLLSKWTEAIPGVSGAEDTFWQWEDFPTQPPGTGWEKRRERSYVGMVLPGQGAYFDVRALFMPHGSAWVSGKRRDVGSTFCVWHACWGRRI